MSELVRAYESPSGSLDQETATAVTEAVDQQLAAIEDLAIAEELEEAINEVLDEYQQQVESGEAIAAPAQGYTQQGDSLASMQHRLQVEGDAFLRVTRICNGWEPEPVPDQQANGYMTLNVGVTEAGVDPVIWGDLFDCRYLVPQLSDARVVLDGGTLDREGDVRIFVGENLSFEQFRTARLLFDVDVTASLNDAAVTLRPDFLIDLGAEQIELRVATATGDLVAIAGAGALVGVRASNGEYACDIAARTCTDSETNLTVEF